MKLSVPYNLVILGCCLLSLWIPLWFSAFGLAAIVGYFYQFDFKKSVYSHFIIYSAVCIIFCFYAYNTGGKELVMMIGEIFQGLSNAVLILLSSILQGISAVCGVWTGIAIRKIQQDLFFTD